MLIPVTLLAILLINFIILNLAPGDPSTIGDMGEKGSGSRSTSAANEYSRDDGYLIFREHYGLTLPILLNAWPGRSKEKVEADLYVMRDRRSPGATSEMGGRRYRELRLSFGDRCRYLMPSLLAIAEDGKEPLSIRELALHFFIRGGIRMGITGANLTVAERNYNTAVSRDNIALRRLSGAAGDFSERLDGLKEWYEARRDFYNYEPGFGDKFRILFLETRLMRYLKRVATLDFGAMRNDANRQVINEVARRIKYSLTLALLPMGITFILCQVFGFLMAVKHDRWPDRLLNLLFLSLYAAPIFVVAPWLIEKVALHHAIPFLPTSIPTGGFHSAPEIYSQMTSWERLGDTALHLALPLIALTYGTLASQTRLSRTAVLEVLQQDFIRTARAKGLSFMRILTRHVAPNAAIPIVTSLATSLGALLAGSLVIETVFNIDGFGRFFYEAVINRDYNVILFSTLAGALLTLVGYLLADIAYTLLDPRISLTK